MLTPSFLESSAIFTKIHNFRKIFYENFPKIIRPPPLNATPSLNAVYAAAPTHRHSKMEYKN